MSFVPTSPPERQETFIFASLFAARKTVSAIPFKLRFAAYGG